ncbi:hypothetical protein [Mariniflexile sp. HMF6888]|uniref:hypothetical protein n=1 Tax=Mariniflexile sp. HMF6888 TaxID=3373086 RepID=UPI003787E21B
MIQHLLTHKRTNKKFVAFEDRDFEMKNPIEQYENKIIIKQMILNGIPKEEMTGEKEFSAMSKEIFKNAFNDWLKLKGEFQAIKVPENLIQLLKTDSKEDQEKLLKKLTVTPEVLTAFIFMAYHKFGYTLSQYTFRFPKRFFETTKMLHVKIIDCGAHWHCFFTIFNSLGDEKPTSDDKEEYLYYMSSAFGIDRTEIVNQIKLKGFRLKLSHLPYITLKHYEHSYQMF